MHSRNALDLLGVLTEVVDCREKFLNASDINNLWRTVIGGSALTPDEYLHWYSVIAKQTE